MTHISNTTSRSGRAARLSLAALFAMTMAACGGGGGGSSDPVVGAPAPSPSPSPSPSGQTFATAQAFVLSGDAVLDAVNRERDAAGLGALSANAALDTAAFGHSKWLRLNGYAFGHDQTSGTTGFTGATTTDRVTAAGYNWGGFFEDVYGPALDPVRGVNMLMGMPFHRAGLMAHGQRDFGKGFYVDASGSGSLVTVLGFKVTDAQQDMKAAAGKVSVYPVDGATGVPIMMAQEAPDPVPSLGGWGPGRYPGYTVSLQVRADQNLTVTSFKLVSDTGAEVASKLLDKNDPLFFGDSGITNWAAIVPLAPLAPGKVYTAMFTGSVDGTALTRTWSFTTRAAGITATAARKTGYTVVTLKSASDMSEVTGAVAGPACAGYTFSANNVGFGELVIKDATATVPPAGCTLSVTARDLGSSETKTLDVRID